MSSPVFSPPGDFPPPSPAPLLSCLEAAAQQFSSLVNALALPGDTLAFHLSEACQANLQAALSHGRSFVGECDLLREEVALRARLILKYQETLKILKDKNEKLKEKLKEKDTEIEQFQSRAHENDKENHQFPLAAGLRALGGAEKGKQGKSPVTHETEETQEIQQEEEEEEEEPADLHDSVDSADSPSPSEESPPLSDEDGEASEASADFPLSLPASAAAPLNNALTTLLARRGLASQLYRSLIDFRGSSLLLSLVTAKNANARHDLLQQIVNEKYERMMKPRSENTEAPRNSGRGLELFSALIFRSLGYQILSCGGGPGDGGCDLRVKKNSQISIIQCKQYLNSQKVSESELRDFYGVLTAERVNQGFFLTTNNFSSAAIKFQENFASNSVQLWNKDKIFAVLQDNAEAVETQRSRLFTQFEALEAAAEDFLRQKMGEQKKNPTEEKNKKNKRENPPLPKEPEKIVKNQPSKQIQQGNKSSSDSNIRQALEAMKIQNQQISQRIQAQPPLPPPPPSPHFSQAAAPVYSQPSHPQNSHHRSHNVSVQPEFGYSQQSAEYSVNPASSPSSAAYAPYSPYYSENSSYSNFPPSNRIAAPPAPATPQYALPAPPAPQENSSSLGRFSGGDAASGKAGIQLMIRF